MLLFLCYNLNGDKMKNVIFDIGGVITNFSDLILVDYLNMPIEEVKQFTKIVYSSYEWRECLKGRLSHQEVINSLSNKIPRELLNKLLLKDNIKYVLPFRTGILEEISKIKQKYKIYILSNLTKDTYEYLNELKIFDIFDGTVFSYECGLTKPDHDIYELLIEKYNLKKEECILFDDSNRNIEMGNKLGIKSVLYKDIDDLKSNLEY